MLLVLLLGCDVTLDCDEATSVRWAPSSSGDRRWRIAALSADWTRRGIDRCVVPDAAHRTLAGWPDVPAIEGGELQLADQFRLYTTDFLPMRHSAPSEGDSLAVALGPDPALPGRVYWPAPTNELTLDLHASETGATLDWDGTRLGLDQFRWVGAGRLPDQVSALTLSVDGTAEAEITGTVETWDLTTWALLDAPGATEVNLDLPGPRQSLALRTADGAEVTVFQPEGTLLLAGVAGVTWTAPAEDLCLGLTGAGQQVPVASGGTLRLAPPLADLTVLPEDNSASIHLPTAFQDLEVTVASNLPSADLEVRVGRRPTDEADFDVLTIRAATADVSLLLPDGRYRFTGTTPTINAAGVDDDPTSERTVDVVAATVTVAGAEYDYDTDACWYRAAEAVELLEVEE